MWEAKILTKDAGLWDTIKCNRVEIQDGFYQFFNKNDKIIAEYNSKYIIKIYYYEIKE